MRNDTRAKLEAERPFGGWLLEQRHRACYIGGLARAAARDRAFPTAGTVRQVRARILGQVWDEDTLGAIEDAVTEWSTMLSRQALAELHLAAAPSTFAAVAQSRGETAVQGDARLTASGRVALQSSGR